MNRLITTIFDNELSFKKFIEEFKLTTGIILKRGGGCKEYVCSLNNSKNDNTNNASADREELNNYYGDDRKISALENIGKWVYFLYIN